MSGTLPKCVTCQGTIRSLEYNHNIIWIFPHFWDYINYIMTSCTKPKIDWSSEVSFPLLRNWNSSKNLSLSLNQKSGSISQLNSENKVTTVLRFSAEKNGLTFLIPKPAKRNGKNCNFAIFMIHMRRWELAGASYRKNLTGKFYLNIELKIASRTGSMVPSGTIFALFSVILIPAEHAIISKLAN